MEGLDCTLRQMGASAGSVQGLSHWRKKILGAGTREGGVAILESKFGC